MKVLRCLSLFALMVLSFSSCRIFEDRDECPCWLTFSIDRFPEIPDDISVYGVRDFDGNVFRQVLNGQGCELEVPRGMYHCSVFAGIDKCIVDNMVYLVPEGIQTDCLFLHLTDVDCRDEFAEDLVYLRKEWVTVKVSLFGATKDDEKTVPQDLSVVVSSDVCGLDLLTGRPVAGSYHYSPDLIDGSLSFRLLRHSYSTDNLVVDIYDDERLIDTYHLGQSLTQSGYDWNEPNLSDVLMSLDLQNSESFIKVVPWNGQNHEHIIF